MKVVHGKTLPVRPPLPNHPNGYRSVPLRVGLSEQRKAEEERRALTQSIAASQSLKIPARLDAPHPAVAEIMSNPVASHNSCTRRGFRMADTIARACENAGFQVEASGQSLLICSNYRRTPISVSEKLSQVPILAPDNANHTAAQSRGRHQAFELIPTGYLQIMLSDHKWGEEPLNDLEVQLPELLSKLIMDRKHDADEAEKAAERKRLREIASATRAREKRIAEQEAAAFERFLQLASQWVSTNHARSFLAAIEANGAVSVEQPTIDWLRTKIDTLDPLHEGPDAALAQIKRIRGGVEQQ
ncbi:hypothetical protein [Mesorhizobium sp. NPDC059025]|uniref:hypothetical protein n=1 Tax=unclassified Mesorhizobium TaxID=325217 RepID=UPI003691A18D